MRAPTTLALLVGAALSLDTVACSHLGSCHDTVETTKMTGELHAFESVHSALTRAVRAEAGDAHRDAETSDHADFTVAPCNDGPGNCISLYHAFASEGLWDFVITMKAPTTLGLVALEDLDAQACQSPSYDEDAGTLGPDDCTLLHGTLDVHSANANCNFSAAPCTTLDAQLQIDADSGDGPSVSGNVHLFSDDSLVDTECTSSGCKMGGGPGDL